MLCLRPRPVNNIGVKNRIKIHPDYSLDDTDREITSLRGRVDDVGAFRPTIECGYQYYIRDDNILLKNQIIIYIYKKKNSLKRLAKQKRVNRDIIIIYTCYMQRGFGGQGIVGHVTPERTTLVTRGVVGAKRAADL